MGECNGRMRWDIVISQGFLRCLAFFQELVLHQYWFDGVLAILYQASFLVVVGLLAKIQD